MDGEKNVGAAPGTLGAVVVPSDPQRRRWRVKQGRWTWKPMRLSDALSVAKRQLWGATESVTIEPCIIPPQYERNRRRGEL